MRIFLDTNVFFDYVLGREPEFEHTRHLMLVINGNRLVCGTNPNNFPHAYFHMMKEEGADSWAVKHELALLRQVIQCIPLDNGIVDKALARRSPIDMEDGITLELAIAFNADVFITRDPTGFRLSPIPVRSPQQFLDEWYA